MPPKTELVREWIRLAGVDLESAEHLLSRDPPLLETACFHIQQSIEKALKAVLVLNDQRPPRTHCLEDLLGLCDRWMPGVAEFESGCAWLSGWAVELRYPNNPPSVTPELAGGAAKTAKAVLDYIRDRLPPEVRT